MTAEMSVLMIQWEESDCSDIRCGYSNKKRGCAGINYIIGSVHKEQQRHAVLNGNGSSGSPVLLYSILTFGCLGMSVCPRNTSTCAVTCCAVSQAFIPSVTRAAKSQQAERAGVDPQGEHLVCLSSNVSIFGELDEAGVMQAHRKEVHRQAAALSNNPSGNLPNFFLIIHTKNEQRSIN
eukprot:1150027-Pelagomonas_calceolata.AAC.8